MSLLASLTRPINVVPLYQSGALPFGKFLCLRMILIGWSPLSPIVKSDMPFSPLSRTKLQGLMVSTWDFSKRLWHIMGDSVKDEVKHIFNSRKVPDYLNKILITLIMLS